jgi:hypothetical protein
MGRPRDYTPELGERICQELAQVGSLRRVCRNEWAPYDYTVRRWIVENEGFAVAYARAKEAGIDALVEEGLDIADDGLNDFRQVAQAGGEVAEKLDVDHVSRSKLRVGYRQWLAERMAPKKYGVKQDITSGGEPLKPADTAPVFNVTLNTTESPKR